MNYVRSAVRDLEPAPDMTLKWMRSIANKTHRQGAQCDVLRLATGDRDELDDLIEAARSRGAQARLQLRKDLFDRIPVAQVDTR